MSKSRLNDCNIIVFCTHVNSQWDRGSQFSTVIPSMLLEILTKLPLWFVCVPVFVCVCVMHCSWLLLCVHMYIAIAPWEANEISGMSNGRVLLLLTIWICVDASCINRQTWVWLGGGFWFLAAVVEHVDDGCGRYWKHQQEVRVPA